MNLGTYTDTLAALDAAAQPAPPPFNAKAYVLTLAGGDTAKAKTAWDAMKAKPSWTAEQLDEAFEAWVNEEPG